MQRTDWRQERKLNSETFGVAATRRGKYVVPLFAYLFRFSLFGYLVTGDAVDIAEVIVAVTEETSTETTSNNAERAINNPINQTSNKVSVFFFRLNRRKLCVLLGYFTYFA